ncbi:hypothetical protein COY33_02590 [candidate division WWE3 bacterium CG_4_10_14_0_2_um_filter_42_7]|uniref:Uncharacterized protein n=2 Tax=Katanobacteria TaxID=422282 RepID=A0A2H0X8R0_UNCKA|nr:MAG: hypothetical protein COT51_03480 [candidate division WWE3 bacterium CG08_land_8_20_14_0_20_41_15]PIZ42786.1 MAG: hypothetical protein COY33_02590 [candidate division WWE3 bacterium CG_4_10_14_0_2_um_filter_42_7]
MTKTQRPPEVVTQDVINKFKGWRDSAVYSTEHLNELFRKRDADEIKTSNLITGCSDNARVLQAEFERNGVSALLAKGVLENYLNGKVEKPDGHIFVYLPDQNIFVDPVTLEIAREEGLHMPGGQYKGEKVLIRKGLSGSTSNGAFKKFPSEISTPKGDIEDWEQFKAEYQGKNPK